MKLKIPKVQLPTGMSKVLWRVRDFVVDHSPAICTGFGMSCMLCGALKVFVDSEKNVQIFQSYDYEKKYEPEDAMKNLAVNLVKQNAFSTLLEASGMALIATGYGIQASRLSKAVVAFTGLTEAYNALYSKYAEAVGEEEAKNSLVDRAMLVEMTGKQDENGHEIVKETPMNKVSAAARYGFMFGPLNKNWEPNSMAANWAFVRGIQDIARIRFNTRGRLVWNECLLAFDEEEKQDGMVVGWSMDSDGDHYIDFGIDELFEKWQNGEISDADLAGGIPIIPNVDGLIMQYYPKA